MSDVLLIARAWNFSAERHAKQRRKGEAQEPYMNHLAEVAELVATATEGHDANLAAAAVYTTLSRIQRRFSANWHRSSMLTLPVWWRRPPTTSDSIKWNGNGFKSSMRAQKRPEPRFSN